MPTYKVWVHVEEIDDDGEAVETEPAEPRELGEFDELDEATEFVDSLEEA